MSGWLEIFEGTLPYGTARGETDAGTALALFREAVAAGTAERTPEWEWCYEIHMRVFDSRPPVTEAEYLRLVAWYGRHRLADGVHPGINDPNISMLIYGFYMGPRRLGATEAVVALRRLCAAHPELGDWR